MQTFLPTPDFAESARVLDNRRLGKQRLECQQILTALTVPGSGWRNHPATIMWQGHEVSLLHYMQDVVDEWVRRGFKNSIQVPWMLKGDRSLRPPPWLGKEEFHASHRSNLLRKDPTHYGKFGWTEPSDLPYYWPSKHQQETNMRDETTDHQHVNTDADTVVPANPKLAALQEKQAEILLTLYDLGVAVDEELQAEITDLKSGRVTVNALDAEVKKHIAKPLAPASDEGHTTKKRAAKKAAVTPKETSKEKTVTATAKKTKKTAAKKAPAKKASAKAKDVTAKKSATANARTSLDPAAKITWKVEANPAREGSARFERYELLRKSNGKTVETAIKNGVPSATLLNASKAGVITIK